LQRERRAAFQALAKSRETSILPTGDRPRRAPPMMERVDVSPRPAPAPTQQVSPAGVSRTMTEPIRQPAVPPAASPLALFCWPARALILRLARREVEARYRGSILGVAWSVLTPLALLSVYTYVFSVIFQARWETPTNGRGQFAVLLFSGLIVFSIFSETVNRAPGLMLENVSYIKKVVFPLEAMAWVALLGSLFNAGVSFLVLLAFYLAAFGLPPITVVLLPVVLAPLALVVLGITWFLASLGVFLRDVKQFVGIVTTVMLFGSPILYPVSAIPEAMRAYVYANPLTLVLENSKQVLFWGTVPDPRYLALSTVVAWGIAWLGYTWFMKTRKGFADVV
jgi:lipopolysaccharide transport system permease protein